MVLAPFTGYCQRGCRTKENNSHKQRRVRDGCDFLRDLGRRSTCWRARVVGVQMFDADASTGLRTVHRTRGAERVTARICAAVIFQPLEFTFSFISLASVSKFSPRACVRPVSYHPARKHRFNLPDRVSGVQVFRANVRAVQNTAATKQAVRIFQIVEPGVGGHVTRVDEEPVRLQ
jgi:hypothetical protein